MPLQCEFFALEGLSQLLKTVEQVKNSLNPKLTIHGIVLTMFDSRNNLSNQVVADVRQFMGRKVYDTVIPRNVRISEAPSYGKPVLVYDLEVRRQRSLFAARHRDHPAREGVEGKLDAVMRGLDPRIHDDVPQVMPDVRVPPLKGIMDCRVKPGNDRRKLESNNKRGEAWREGQERRRWRIIRD